MKKNDALYQLIDRYLAGELDAQELAAFDLRLKQDGDLKRLLERERKIDRDLNAFLAVQGEQKLLANLKELGEQFFEEETPATKKNPQAIVNKKTMRYWWFAAAAACLLATWLIWRFLLPSPPPEQLFAESLQQFPEEISLVTKGASTEDFAAIQAAFDQENYTEVANIALPLVEQLYLDGEENYDLTFALGYSYLQLNLPQIALPYFTALQEDYNYPQPYWYRALALLDLGDIPACKEELKVLMQQFPSSKYAASGEVLLGEL